MANRPGSWFQHKTQAGIIRHFPLTRRPASAFFPARADNQHGLVPSVVQRSSWTQILAPGGRCCRRRTIRRNHFLFVGYLGSGLTSVSAVSTDKLACGTQWILSCRMTTHPEVDLRSPHCNRHNFRMGDDTPTTIAFASRKPLEGHDGTGPTSRRPWIGRTG